MAAATFQFGEYELDRDRFELRRNGTSLRLERKPLELLILLASSGGRLVSREEIARHLWPSEVFVDTEHGINTAVRKIRYALRENPDRPRFLETVTGKGYRFIGVVTPPQPVAPPRPQPEPEPAVGVLASAPAAPHPSRSRLRVTALLTAGIAALVLLVAIQRARRHTTASVSPAAREAYTRGYYLWFSNREPESGAYFLRATQLAPGYALAWAGLADYYGAGMVDGDLDPRQDLPLQDAAAHRAVQLDDSLAQAHLAIGASHWIVDWNYTEALQELDRAIQLDPRFTEAIHLRAKLLGQLNRHDEAIAGQRLAIELSPTERPWALAYFLVLARRYDAAIADAQQRLEGNPNPLIWGVLAAAYRAKGMDSLAEHASEQSLLLAGDTAAAAASHQAFAIGGMPGVDRWQLASLQTEARKHYVSPFRFAVLYARLGQQQQAFEALDETVSQHSPMIFDVQNEPAFDSLHTDPRFRALIRRVGLPPAAN